MQDMRSEGHGRIFIEAGNGVYTPLGEVTEADLTCGYDEQEEYKHYYDKESTYEFEFKGDFDEFYRAVLGKGYYNAMVLKRDGYLSPKNGMYT